MTTPRATDPCVFAMTLIVLASTIGLPGCQSDATSKEGKGCSPEPGMTTEQLALCGCFPMKSGGDYSIGLNAQDTNQSVQQVRTLNYFCPSRTAGFIKVITLNGIAQEVFR
ncbi:hypothetical protein [Imhoffiella purpurea]|uniref:Uncharacterized protein n=1 Tax=Imhoffiella purpurea TaxID=1249627 RepID=W9VEV4_9GAMM|nr:hypothetical protein [Imhoffiella purpurea]EXJ15516.1 hypothetical protein D779_1258 [Imhoffiella purpurea]